MLNYVYEYYEKKKPQIDKYRKEKAISDLYNKPYYKDELPGERKKRITETEFEIRGFDKTIKYIVEKNYYCFRGHPNYSVIEKNVSYDGKVHSLKFDKIDFGIYSTAIGRLTDYTTSDYFYYDIIFLLINDNLKVTAKYRLDKDDFNGQLADVRIGFFDGLEQFYNDPRLEEAIQDL